MNFVYFRFMERLGRISTYVLFMRSQYGIRESQGIVIGLDWIAWDCDLVTSCFWLDFSVLAGVLSPVWGKAGVKSFRNRIEIGPFILTFWN